MIKHILRPFCSNKLNTLIQSLKSKYNIQFKHSLSDNTVNIQLNVDKQYRKIKATIQDTLAHHGYKTIIKRPKSSNLFDASQNIGKIKQIFLMVGNMQQQPIVKHLKQSNSVQLIECQANPIDISRQIYLKQWNNLDILIIKIHQKQLNLDVIRNLPIRGAIISNSQDITTLLTTLSNMKIPIYGCFNNEIALKYGLKHGWMLHQNSQKYLYYNTTNRKIELIQDGKILLTFSSSVLRKVYGQSVDPEVYPTNIKRAGNAFIVNWSDGEKNSVYTIEFLEKFREQ